jgi:threonylcarbamoyladenosine tRNA methylthiotransferase MtaB
MRRRYDTAQYREAVGRLRAQIGDDLAITTDVIVGFPGETDADFESSLAFCRELRFAQMHVFPYSKRSGTIAALMPAQVAPDVKHERMQRMLAVARDSRRAFIDRFGGRTMPVLWERRRDDEGGVPLWDGLTDNYIRVSARDTATPLRRDLRNQITPARLLTPRDDGFDGEAL